MTYVMQSDERRAYDELVTRLALIKQVQHKVEYAKKLIQTIEDECSDFRIQLIDMQDRLMEKQGFLETLSYKD